MNILSNKVCIKCGSYCEAKINFKRLISPDKTYAIELIIRTCTICGYKWYEDTADAKPIEPVNELSGLKLMFLSRRNYEQIKNKILINGD